jgi:hypothetical protein
MRAQSFALAMVMASMANFAAAAKSQKPAPAIAARQLTGLSISVRARLDPSRDKSLLTPEVASQIQVLKNFLRSESARTGREQVVFLGKNLLLTKSGSVKQVGRMTSAENWGFHDLGEMRENAGWAYGVTAPTAGVAGKHNPNKVVAKIGHLAALVEAGEQKKIVVRNYPEAKLVH